MIKFGIGIVTFEFKHIALVYHNKDFVKTKICSGMVFSVLYKHRKQIVLL